MCIPRQYVLMSYVYGRPHNSQTSKVLFIWLFFLTFFYFSFQFKAARATGENLTAVVTISVRKLSRVGIMHELIATHAVATWWYQKVAKTIKIFTRLWKNAISTGYGLECIEVRELLTTRFSPCEMSRYPIRIGAMVSQTTMVIAMKIAWN